ncbi:hypothetical protein HMI54_003298 [Coelomomyces lativittatus]|nr:hypothetical protein HMI54_003298 [Coelomomyces lativittatus]
MLHPIPPSMLAQPEPTSFFLKEPSFPRVFFKMVLTPKSSFSTSFNFIPVHFFLIHPPSRCFHFEEYFSFPWTCLYSFISSFFIYFHLHGELDHLPSGLLVCSLQYIFSWIALQF